VDLSELRRQRDAILATASRHGARNVRVFGSVVRGEARPDSDIDLLVDVGAEHSAWFPAGLILDLEDLLGQRVHVLTEAALRSYLRSEILQEAVRL